MCDLYYVGSGYIVLYKSFPVYLLTQLSVTMLSATAGQGVAYIRPLRAVGAVSRRNNAVWVPSGSMINDLDGCSEDAAVMPESVHWRNAHRNNIGEVDVRLPHAVYSREEMDAVEITHRKTSGLIDRAAWSVIWILRRAYDLLTGYKLGKQDEKCMIRRVVFLETIAGVPGMVGAAIRHLKSLRKLSRDYGFIHTLLEEAENERMHLMTALLLNNPSKIVRSLVVIAQALFLCLYTTLYAFSPTFCHRLVGYLEEEAVKTYTDMVDKIDHGKLEGFKMAAPPAARAYWGLSEDATMRDVWLAIRADEAHHREVNHTFADLVPVPGAVNPFPPGY